MWNSLRNCIKFSWTLRNFFFKLIKILWKVKLKFSQKLFKIFLKIAGNSLLRFYENLWIIRKNLKNLVKFSLKLHEILLKITWNSLKNWIKFFWKLPEISLKMDDVFLKMGEILVKIGEDSLIVKFS